MTYKGKLEELGLQEGGLFPYIDKEINILKNALEKRRDSTNEEEKIKLDSFISKTNLKIIDDLQDEYVDELNHVDHTIYERDLKPKAKELNPNENILKSLFTKHGKNKVFSIGELKDAGIDSDFNGKKIAFGKYELVQPTFTIYKEYRINKRAV